ncbi:ABC transporter permease [Janthinobacterium fluminis]|uniref:ABC transporter permease n=1 Tax=Janthinobacterium fluminis TaxID=2987524 RepID=A0ABT5K817_9BURK|nr:ABC transporter permease [Janthinobacterium fluminis]MDC8760956.1 ABC transporter permease [Janthinobacterium fluminis]
MIFTLLKIEILKTRRSLALMTMLACPFMVVLLNTGMLLKSGQLNVASALPWQNFWMGNLALWCHFMLPLYIALLTGLINGNEHRNHTWRLMLTLPITHRQLYLAKLLLALCLVAGADVGLMLLCGAVLGVFVLCGYPLAGNIDLAFVTTLLKISVASLPIVIIQHAVSTRFSNIVMPLALGIIATMGILQLGNSEYWRFFPWSYTLMALNGSAVEMQTSALGLAIAVGLPALVLSSIWLERREIKD